VQPRPLVLAFAFLLLAAPALAAPRAFPLGQWGQLEIDVPEGWTAVTQGKEAEGGTVLKVTPPKDAQLVLLMTPLPAPGNADDIDAAAREATEKAKLGPVQELESPDAHAFYASVTDRTVFVDQGTAAVGRLLVSFTIRTNVREGAERAQAREIVRTARQLFPGPPWITPGGGVAMSYPGKAWKLAMNLAGYEIDPFQIVAGGKGVRVTGRNQATGMIVSAVLKDAHPGWTAVEHREDAWKTMQTESPMGREDVKRSERGPMALLEMRVPTYWGRVVDQQNVSAYLVRDGVRADVHLSKVKFKEEDRVLFEKVLGSVRIEE
jgi:hypothetical protein